MKQKYYGRIQFDQAVPEKGKFKSEADYLQCLTDITVDLTANVSAGWMELPLKRGEIRCEGGRILNQQVYHTPEDILVSLEYTRKPNPDSEGLRVDWGALELFSDNTSVDSLVSQLKERMERMAERFCRD